MLLRLLPGSSPEGSNRGNKEVFTFNTSCVVTSNLQDCVKNLEEVYNCNTKFYLISSKLLHTHEQKQYFHVEAFVPQWLLHLLDTPSFYSPEKNAQVLGKEQHSARTSVQGGGGLLYLFRKLSLQHCMESTLKRTVK